MSKLTDELNQLSHGSLEMAKEIGRINKKENFTISDRDFMRFANLQIKNASLALRNVSHET